MKIVVAIDSFKGCLSSLEAGEAVVRGAKRATAKFKKECEFVVVPIADGGEGSVEAMKAGARAHDVQVHTQNAFGKAITATYALNQNLAIMEMASAAGLGQSEERDPLKASTYGVGIMIKDAINRGVRKFIMGIGGSATNDGGCGMLEALGFKFYDKDGVLLSGRGENLIKIASISDESVAKEIFECEFDIACDVTNPLYGELGAAYVYGAQKGADEAMIKLLDLGLRNLAKITHEFNGSSNENLSGSGAAGGLGFGFVSFLNAKLKKGFDIISSLGGLKEALEDADIVVTGEGRIDFQSSMGKTPSCVARLAKECGVPFVVALAGSVEECEGLNACGVDACFCIQKSPCTLDEAIKNAAFNLEHTANQVMRLLV